MNKDELRKKYKIIRNNIEDREEKDILIIDKITDSDIYRNSHVLALYSPIYSEVDTYRLFEIAKKDNKMICYPKVLDEDNMEFYIVDSIDDLKNGSFNIMEPNSDNPTEDIELMIIPGLCFDKHNNRIGYGKGYYDNYLSNHTNIIKIGICYKEQLIDDITTSPNDIKMDYVITD